MYAVEVAATIEPSDIKNVTAPEAASQLIEFFFKNGPTPDWLPDWVQEPP
jgi:hypothetical protein